MMQYAHRLIPATFGLGHLQALAESFVCFLRMGGGRDVARDFDRDDRHDGEHSPADRLRVRRFLRAFANHGITFLNGSGGEMFDGLTIDVADFKDDSIEHMVAETLHELGTLPPLATSPRRGVPAATRDDPETVHLRAEVARLETANREADAIKTASKQAWMRRMLAASGLGQEVLKAKGLEPDWRGLGAKPTTMTPAAVEKLLGSTPAGREVLAANRSL